MPDTHAALPMPITYFLLVLRAFAKTPEERAALVAGTGVTPGQLREPGAEITLGQQLRQVQNLNRLQRPGWALEAGSRFHASTHGPLGFAAVSARTLGESLGVIERYGYVRAPYYRIASRTEGQEFAMQIQARVPLQEAERVPLFEQLLLSAQALVESVTGTPLREARFEFDYPAPAYARRYSAHFHGPVRFGCGQTALVIPAAWLSKECPLADPLMFELSRRKLEAYAARIELRDSLACHVERLLDASGDAGLSLDEVAQRLHLSTRTLVRRLGQEGVSFRSLRDRHHRERAEELLREAELDVAEIGYRLGYRDPANFGRACRRWFGASPGRTRKRLRHGS